MKKIITFLFFLFSFGNVTAQCNITAAFTYTVGPNGQVNFTNTSTMPNFGNDSSVVILWDFGNNQHSYTSSSPNAIYPFNGTYQVILKIWAYANANPMVIMCLDTNVETIHITNADTCVLQAGFTYTVGANGEVDFTNTAKGTQYNYDYYGTQASTNILYKWDFSSYQNYLVDTNNTMPNSWFFHNNGTYTVALTAYTYPGTCTSIYTDTINITNVISCQPPQINFTMNSLGSGNWQAVTTYSNVIYVQWLWGDGTSDGGYVPFTPSHTYTTAGVYQICVNAWNDTIVTCYDSVYVCQNDSLYRLQQSSQNMINVQVIDATTGIKQVSNNNKQIMIYPNPANDVITLEGEVEIGIISIYNTIGELIQQTRSNQKSITLDISRLASGIYMANALGKYSKFIKQ
jgi:PKD repeat protein